MVGGELRQELVILDEGSTLVGSPVRRMILHRPLVATDVVTLEVFRGISALVTAGASALLFPAAGLY